MPVMLGILTGTYALRVANCTVDTGLSASAVAVTLTRPTIDFVRSASSPVSFTGEVGCVATMVKPRPELVA